MGVDEDYGAPTRLRGFLKKVYTTRTVTLRATPHGSVVAGTSDGRARTFLLQGARLSHELDGMGGPVDSASPADGERLWTTGDGFLCVWDWATRKWVREIVVPRDSGAALIPDGVAEEARIAHRGGDSGGHGGDSGGHGGDRGDSGGDRGGHGKGGDGNRLQGFGTPSAPRSGRALNGATPGAHAGSGSSSSSSSLPSSSSSSSLSKTGASSSSSGLTCIVAPAGGAVWAGGPAGLFAFDPRSGRCLLRARGRPRVLCILCVGRSVWCGLDPVPSRGSGASIAVFDGVTGAPMVEVTAAARAAVVANRRGGGGGGGGGIAVHALARIGGARVWAACSDGDVRVYDLGAGLLKAVEGHTGKAARAVVSCLGYAITAGDDRCACVWRTSDVTLLKRIDLYMGRIRTMLVTVGPAPESAAPSRGGGGGTRGGDDDGDDGAVVRLWVASDSAIRILDPVGLIRPLAPVDDTDGRGSSLTDDPTREHEALAADAPYHQLYTSFVQTLEAEDRRRAIGESIDRLRLPSGDPAAKALADASVSVSASASASAAMTSNLLTRLERALGAPAAAEGDAPPTPSPEEIGADAGGGSAGASLQSSSPVMTSSGRVSVAPSPAWAGARAGPPPNTPMHGPIVSGAGPRVPSMRLAFGNDVAERLEILSPPRAVVKARSGSGSGSGSGSARAGPGSANPGAASDGTGSDGDANDPGAALATAAARAEGDASANQSNLLLGLLSADTSNVSLGLDVAGSASSPIGIPESMLASEDGGGLSLATGGDLLSHVHIAQEMRDLQVRASDDPAVAVLQKHVSQLVKDQDAMITRMARGEAELEAARAAAVRSGADVAALGAENAALREALERANAEREALRANVHAERASRSAEAGGLQQKHDDAWAQVEAMRAELEQARAEVVALQGERDSLTVSLSESESKRSRLVEELRACRFDIRKLTRTSGTASGYGSGSGAGAGLRTPRAVDSASARKKNRDGRARGAAAGSASFEAGASAGGIDEDDEDYFLSARQARRPWGVPATPDRTPAKYQRAISENESLRRDLAIAQSRRLTDRNNYTASLKQHREKDAEQRQELERAATKREAELRSAFARERKTLHERVRAAEAAAESLDGSRASLRSKAEAAEAEIVSLRRRHGEEHRSREVIAAYSKELEARLEAAEAMAAAAAAAAASGADSVADLPGAAGAPESEATADPSALGAAAEGLVQRTFELQGQVDSLRAQLHSRDMRIAELESRAREVHAVADLEARLNVERGVQDLRSERDEERKRAAKAEAALEAACKELDDARATIAKLTADLTDTRENLSGKLKEARAQIAKMDHAKGLLTKEIAQMRAALFEQLTEAADKTG